MAPEDVIDTGLDQSIFDFNYREIQIDLTQWRQFPGWPHLFVLLALPFLMA